MVKYVESEEFVLLSGPRSGLKREFAFALKGQSEVLDGSIGRTRATKLLNPSFSSSSGNKRFKNLENDEKFDRNLVMGTDLSKEGGKRIDATVLPVCEESNEVTKSLICEEPSINLVGSLQAEEPPNLIDGDNGVSERPVIFYSRLRKKETREIPASENEEAIESDSSCKNQQVVEGECIRAPLSNKLEMKMSKKIGLTKFPTKLNELLGTGLLEGLHVSYIFGKKKEGLDGKIEKCGILCFCSFCNGRKVVSPMEFERHAGSGNKRAADYIYLENGNNLRYVMNACRNAPLDTLQSTIKNAVCSSPSVNKTTICSDCKGHLHWSPMNKAATLCTQCLESRKSQANVSWTSGTKTRSSKAVLPSEFAPRTTNVRGRLTKKDVHLHKLVFEEGGLHDGAELGYYHRGQKLLEGSKRGFGILCGCCNDVVSPSVFEAHAGWASRRKPYLNIYTSNGVSLHELSVSLSKDPNFSPRENDDLCSICADFGDLLLCDGCPRAFHRDCVGLSNLPPGKWYCSHCQQMYQREKFCEYNANAIAAGRVLGDDPIKQIYHRCIRTVKTQDVEVGGCALCRAHSFCKSGFGPGTVLLCDQCEKEYHVGCLKDHNMADLEELPEGEWFCCTDCKAIHTTLHQLLERKPLELPESLSGLIKTKHMEKCSSDNGDLDLRWSLLSGKLATADSNLFLSKAVAIFRDHFDPIIDLKSGRDLIPAMVLGRVIRDQDFGGMYCAVLTSNSIVVSAAILRIFGQKIAELPLVATSSEVQGRGYFQSLFSCIELLLGYLKVETLVLPAAEEAESIWTNKFGFKKINQEKLNKYRRNCQMMVFQGTSMLEKPVPPCMNAESFLMIN
ncbi:uncharacterized protein LOC113310615 isoform X1 [Papaver somniferum]|uniref:uncharacterized protein LOC113310615 isoform X1 n=1 Tax=Papaver somniferum TaxID=3469 RepID=UPI000E6F831C|nr:uncharacterized protein LOC113310615 isoform X1 [Papaver somniferum]XP_026415121.1 uncharacterized protein LOC113310615 isoform X1 [Papaver somniferum]